MDSFYVILGALPILSVGAVVFNAISGTGNTKAALILEFIALAFYSLYMYWVIVIEQAPTAICWTVEYVYWGGLLIAGILYFKYAKWQIKSFDKKRSVILINFYLCIKLIKQRWINYRELR